MGRRDHRAIWGCARTWKSNIASLKEKEKEGEAVITGNKWAASTLTTIFSCLYDIGVEMESNEPDENFMRERTAHLIGVLREVGDGREDIDFEVELGVKTASVILSGKFFIKDLM